MTGPVVLSRVVGAVQVVTLNRPDRRNALDPALVAALHREIDVAESDPGVGAVVFTGAGAAFCAGADLVHLDELARADQTPTGFIAGISELIRRLELSPLPFVAAINGAAVAGGLELALGCDIVLAAESARVGDGHLRNGLLPGGGGRVRLPRKVGASWARWLLLTGELVPVRQLLPSGWLHAVVADDELIAAALAAASTLAEHAGGPQTRLKRLLADLDDLSVSSGLEHELRTFDAHWHEHDVMTDIRRFLARSTVRGAAS